MFLRNNSHMVGVDDLMDSACEQDDPEQVFTKLADHGNGNGGSVDAELDTRSRDVVFPSASNTPGIFLEMGKSDLCRTSFASGKQVTATLVPPWQRIPLSGSGQCSVSPCIALLSVGGPGGAL